MASSMRPDQRLPPASRRAARGAGGVRCLGGLVLRDRCERCGLSYAFADSGDGPAVFAIFILGFLVLGCALLLEFRLDPPVWVHLVLWGLLTRCWDSCSCAC